MSKKRKHSTRNRSPRPKINQAELYSVLTDYLPDEEIEEVCTKLTQSNQIMTPDLLRDKVKHIIEDYLNDNKAYFDCHERDNILFYYTTLFAPDNITIPLSIIADFNLNTIGFRGILDEVPEEYLLITCDLLNKINNENFFGAFAIDSFNNYIYYYYQYLFIPENLTRRDFNLYVEFVLESLQEYYPALNEMAQGNFEIKDKEKLKDSLKSLLKVLKK